MIVLTAAMVTLALAMFVNARQTHLYRRDLANVPAAVEAHRVECQKAAMRRAANVAAFDAMGVTR